MANREIGLTGGQTGVWFGQRLGVPGQAYNVSQYTEIRGTVDTPAFVAAVRRMVDETEAYRLAFHDAEHGPRQTLLPPGDWTPVTVDVSQEKDPDAAAIGWMESDLDAPVELIGGALFNIALLKLAEDRHWFFQRAHHALLDGYSGTLTLNRTAEIYTALVRAEPVPPSPAGTLDELLAAEAEYRASDSFAADREHWLGRTQRRGAPVSLSDRTRPASAKPLRCSARLPAGVLDGIRSFARAERTGWTAAVTAAVAAFLYRLTGTREVSLSLPVTGRSTPAERRTPSMMANVLPLHLTVTGSEPVGDLVRQTSAEMRRTLRHQRFRNEDLRRELGTVTEGAGGFGPLVNILAFDQGPSFDGHIGVVRYLNTGPVEDLQVVVHPEPGGDGLLISFDGNPACYDPAELSSHLDRFLRFVEEFARDRDRSVDAVTILSGEEHDRLVSAWPGRSVEVRPDTLPELFAASAARRPEHTAVVCGEDSLTYAELNTRANRLAHHLVDQGIGPDTVVAVSLPRSLDMVVALLAVLKAGGAYLPVDPGYPDDRVRHMLDDAAPKLVINGAFMSSEGAAPGLLRYPDHNPDLRGALLPGHLAYLIYTSGSTGRPKAVAVTHAGIPSLAADHLARYGMTPDSRVLQFASLSFDAAVVDLINALFSGATLVLPPPGPLVGRELADFLVTREVTHAMVPPAVLATLPAGEYPALEVLITGGDVLPRELAARWAAGRRMFNAYGPTESTVDAVVAEVPADGTGPVPIGTPVWNTRAYVLDGSLRPVPAGVPGELYLSGVGLARGYLNRPALTAERFVPAPYGAPGERMYRTGDTARWRADGMLEYLGRTDDQIKLRGFRIELGEVQAAVTECPGVAAAAVVLREDRPGDHRLVAYVVPDGATPVDTAGLGRRLPGHMLPSAFVTLDALPLNPSGKLDRTALPAPRQAARPRRAPRTAHEEVLRTLFTEVLGTPEVGIDDSFFDLGGHSLLATRLVSHIRSALGVEIPLRTVFEAPTVAGLARHLDTTDRRTRTPLTRRTRPRTLPLSHAQNRLWLLNQVEGPSATYNLAQAAHLTGPLDTAALEAALSDVVARHEALRTVCRSAGGDPFQVVLDIARARPVLERAAGGETVETAARRPFDLSDGLPLRAVLFEEGPEEHVLLLVIHHIAADGWSMTPLGRDLSQAYAARLHGHAPDWEPLPVQYADYTLWQHELLDG
ncbi:amino acid adenylation domain-containing protein, partial [Streptomyces lavendulae]